MIALFQVERLHPNAVAGLYLTAAQLACTRGDLDRALDHLSRYADLCPRFFPCVLHGDDFFDALDDWFAEFALGSDAPREEKLIRASMLQAVRDQPIFAPLAGLPRFQGILDRIARSLEL